MSRYVGPSGTGNVAAALKLVRAKGIPHENREGVEMLIHETERLTIAYTPAKDEQPQARRAAGLRLIRVNPPSASFSSSNY